MKKLLSALPILALCLALMIPAAAETPEAPTFANALRFLAALDAQERAYAYHDPVDGLECVALEVGETGASVPLLVLFNAENDQAVVLAEGIISFDAGNANGVLRTVNDLNASYRFTRFYVEGEGVTCAMNVYLEDGEEAGEIVLEAIELITGILGGAVTLLTPYAN